MQLINPLRQGRDRLRQGRCWLSSALLSIIYHHLFICLFLFTILVSIHLHLASHPLSHTLPPSFFRVPAAPQHRPSPPVTPTSCLHWEYTSLMSDGPHAFSLSLRSYLSRWTVSVSVFFSLRVWTKRPRLPHGWPFESDWALAMELWQKLYRACLDENLEEKLRGHWRGYESLYQALRWQSTHPS